MSSEVLKQDNSDIEEAFSGINFREPVIDGELKSEQLRKLDRQWLIVSEVARRAIKNSGVQNALISFNAEPLSESMPYEAMTKIANSDDRTSKVIKRYDETLGVFLSHNAVPDDVLVPDIRNAHRYVSADDEMKSLANSRRYMNDDSFRKLLERKKAGGATPGITKLERELVSRRYRYARDIKMLGLMAELRDQPVDTSNIEDGLIKHELKSGIKVAIIPEDIAVLNSIIDVDNWEGRSQIKDRVFAVNVDGHEYIMKERKTRRHTDTLQHGHADGLTSEQEFRVAEELSELGTIKQGDVQLKWEKPLGYVEFPDGYQFCLFESDPGLKEKQCSRHDIEREVVKLIDEYRQEYDAVSQRAKEIYRDRRDLLEYVVSKKQSSKIIKFISGIFNKKGNANRLQPDELTIEEFAEVKARSLESAALALLDKITLEHDFVNRDNTGYAISLRPGQHPILGVIGYDFEYYAKDPNEAKRRREAYESRLTDDESVRMKATGISGDRPIVTAASYALLEDIGYKLPPVLTN